MNNGPQGGKEYEDKPAVRLKRSRMGGNSDLWRSLTSDGASFDGASSAGASFGGDPFIASLDRQAEVAVENEAESERALRKKGRGWNFHHFPPFASVAERVSAIISNGTSRVEERLAAMGRSRERSGSEMVNLWHSRMSMGGGKGSMAYSIRGGLPLPSDPSCNGPREPLAESISFCDPEGLVAAEDESLGAVMNALQAFSEISYHPLDCLDPKVDLSKAATKSFVIGLAILGPSRPLGASTEEAAAETFYRWPLAHYTEDRQYNLCDDSVLIFLDLSNPKHPQTKLMLGNVGQQKLSPQLVSEIETLWEKELTAVSPDWATGVDKAIQLATLYMSDEIALPRDNSQLWVILIIFLLTTILYGSILALSVQTLLRRHSKVEDVKKKKRGRIGQKQHVDET